MQSWSSGPYPQARTPAPAPSARSVFGTRRPGPRSRPLPRWLRSSRPLRQLVKVLPRAARQPRYGCRGTAASPAPSGRPFHFGGRSSPEPAKLTPPPASLSRLGFGGHCVLPFPRRDALEHRPRFPRGDAPCRIQQLWEPHQFTTSRLLCQVGCRGKLGAPRLARRRWVRASKMIILYRSHNYVKSLQSQPAAATAHHDES